VSPTADLSVVMPAYDTAAYVGEAIATVLERADRLRELIVVDDGSHDDTAEIARAFGDPVRVIVQENRGAAAARNTGIAAATGAYVGFLDSDDLWMAGAPDPRLTALDADPALAGAGGHRRYFAPGADGAPVPVLEPSPGVEVSTLIVRRERLQELGGFDESFALGEDVDLFSRLRESGRGIAVLDDIVLFVRLRPGSLTRDREAVLHGWMQAGRAAMKRQREREGQDR